MQNIMVHHHLGLGDHFICNGLVRYIHELHSSARLFLPTKLRNFVTVSRMYGDEARIIPVAIGKDEDVAKLPHLLITDKFIKIGFTNVRSDFDVSFFDSAHVPFCARWDYFRVERDQCAETAMEARVGINEEEKFILIHDRGSIGRFKLRISSELRRIYISPLTPCMLDWCSLAEKAEEVHCIDSSFIHLAQSLRVRKGIFHDVRPGPTHFVLRDSWQTIGYAGKRRNQSA